MSVDSSFTFKHKLKAHVKNVHERRHQQVCHICAKTSTTKQGMLEHLKEHDEVKEPGVNCEFCGKLYKSKKLARKHAKNMHEQQGIVHECPQCRKHLPTSFALRHHISYYHNFKLHKCDICDKAFKKAKALMVSFAAWPHVTPMTPVFNESSFYRRITWQRTQELICTIAVFAQEPSNQMEICTHTANGCIRLNGVPLAKRNYY